MFLSLVGWSVGWFASVKMFVGRSNSIVLIAAESEIHDKYQVDMFLKHIACDYQSSRVMAGI